MNTPEIKGTGVALVTPFNNDLSIDFDSLEKILNRTLEGGVDFLVVLGTTGEAALLTLDEKLKLISFVREKSQGKLPIVLGYGGICTAAMIEGFKHYDFTGISALLVVTPYYVKPSQEGLLQHYKAIADASPLPIILYNVPGRTGINMEPETTITLADHPKIIGIKEASGKLFQSEEIIMRRPKGFMVYSGDDAMSFHLINAGANGSISVMANAFPKATASIINNDGKTPKDVSRDTHLQLKAITKAVFVESNPCGIIYLLSTMGLCSNVLRLPLVPVGVMTAQAIDREFKSLTVKE